jgi:hypothetical protein
MEVSAGGGSISVEPAALETLSARISGAERETTSARGALGGSAGAAAAAAGQEPAAAAYARLHTLLAGAVTMLGEGSGALSRAVGQAAAAYVSTDTAVMPAAGGPDAR